MHEPTAEPADASIRRQALDPRHSFIVQAPAGSGKTELLVQRYLVLLAEVESPEEVIAITFTRKAASEMRARVLKALVQGEQIEAPLAAHERQTWALARRVINHAAMRGWVLSRYPSRMRIQTIDALCALLARQLPVLSGFGAVPELTQDPQALYLRAARETVAELEAGRTWSAAIEHLLRHLDNNIAALVRLIATMLPRREQWLRHVADPRAPHMDRQALEGALRAAVEQALRALRAAVPAECADEIAALAAHAGGELARAGADHPLCSLSDLDVLPGGQARDLPAWRAIATLLLTDRGEWRRRVDTRLGFGKASGGGARARGTAQAMKARFAALIEKLGADSDLRRHLDGVRALPPLSYSESQWKTLQALFDLLRLSVAQLELVFRQTGQVDFPAMARAALQALGEPDEPTDLALALDYRIQHLLVDEFQDTSMTQYALLERLTAGWVDGDGRTLFAVGDPMQSIYRFREADVALFLRTWLHGIGQLRPLPLALEVNFRAQAGLVAWVNEAFQRIFSARADIGSGAVPYAPAHAQNSALRGQAVSVQPLTSDDAVAEAEAVVELVCRAREADPAQRIAILVRSRRHVIEIAPRLRAAGLRFQAVEIEHLGHRPIVQDLLALTRCLSHAADRVAWLSVLRAPWCGLSLADLCALADDASDTTVWERMTDAAVCGTLSLDGQGRLERVRPALELALAERGRRALRRRVEGAWLALGGPATVVDRTELQDADVFLDLLAELDAAGDLAEPEELMRRLAELYAVADVAADERLQIMTIHKAKGLEFDTVIVPGLGRGTKPPEPRLLTWHEALRDDGGADLLLAPIRGADEEPDPLCRYLAYCEGERAAQEDRRLLYVAATRAKRYLHLVGHANVAGGNKAQQTCSPKTGSLLACLWPAVAAEFTQSAAAVSQAIPPSSAPKAVALDGAPTGQLRRLPAGWELPAAPASIEVPVSAAAADSSDIIEAVEFSWAGEVAMHVGTVVHRALRRLAEVRARRPDVQPTIAAPQIFERLLAESGLRESALREAAARVRAALEATLADPRGRWILDPRHSDAHAELAVTGVLDGQWVNVVIDRTFVDEQGTRWIIDYKTSAHGGGGREDFLDREQERYRAQLARYARVLRGREHRPVRLGLYFPLLSGWREWSEN